MVKPGDVVCIKGCDTSIAPNPKMTVERIDIHGRLALCAWFNNKSQLFRHVFHTTVLKVV